MALEGVGIVAKGWVDADWNVERCQWLTEVRFSVSECGHRDEIELENELTNEKPLRLTSKLRARHVRLSNGLNVKYQRARGEY